jgi:alkanesulfonate monooxygenase SsuD/methylene tetrahydromethanopterin reductase-like flavin-dependent oxidoreductase (luciferase family)
VRGQVCLVTDVAVSVQAEPAGLGSWLALARRLESAGFGALLMGDHPGSGASPWPALGCAAAVTTTLKLGTYVVQAGVREPMHVAADAASLDVLAPRRVVPGVGAGHTPREWEDIGRQRPRPGDRSGRLAEFADAVAALLNGETVTRQGEYLSLRGSRLDGLPAVGGVRLVVGGGHPAVLRAAARHADVVGLSGLGRTLPDGHQHQVRWSRGELRRQLQLVREAAELAGTAPVIEALVQAVTVTGDRAASICEIAGRIPGASAAAPSSPPPRTCSIVNSPDTDLSTPTTSILIASKDESVRVDPADGQLPQPPRLLPCNRLERRPEPDSGPGLDLADHQRPAV